LIWIVCAWRPRGWQPPSRQQLIAARFFICLASGHNGIFEAPVKRRAYRSRYLKTRAESLVCLLAIVSLYKIDHLYRRMASFPLELSGWPRRFVLERRTFILKSCMPQSEYTMNIFYIIGVIVVVLFVAGFFGLHA
jgi:hypothetical protein